MMDHTLVIKLTSEDGSGSPIGLVESPPMLFLTLKERNPGFSWSVPAVASEVEQFGYGLFEWAGEPQPQNYSPDPNDKDFIRCPWTKDTYTKSYRSDGVTKHSDNVWRPTFTQIDASAEEIEQRTDLRLLEVLRVRNRGLNQSDFVFLPDAPDYVKAKLSEWETYRQALRDLPSQAGYPWDITMPVKPSK
jgi:hypothetical protein